MASLPALSDRGESVEQFRRLRSRIYQLRAQSELKTILVSSGMPSEGKSFVAANLAIALARNNDRSVLLIDGDLRRPSGHKLLGAPNKVGLRDYLAGTAELTDIMQCDSTSAEVAKGSQRDLSNLTFISAGRCDDTTVELVGNHRIEEMMSSLSVHFDWIVIDTPPIMAVTDAVDIARVADAVLLVARGGVTPFEVAQRAQAAFNRSRILGFVLNAVTEKQSGKNYYYNYYGEKDSDDETPRKKDKGR
jgi:capsular exopolysaccharide synthesis family protein